MGFHLLSGNEAVALGAFDAGCRFFAGYPITPATTIFHTMQRLLPPIGGICLQGEDEIASIGYCLGASMAGMKAMTATSGPGISLFSEQISFAVGSEIPLVIVDVQRLGPSTGSATRGADGDIQFLRWGNSGGLPVIVLAPTDVKDCYLLTRHAFNLAEIYRCPVFIASNKEVAMTREGVDIDGLPKPEIRERKAPSGEKGFHPFAASAEHPVPDFLPIGAKRPVRQTSSTHNAEGFITTDPDEIGKNRNRLNEKLSGAASEYALYDARMADRAETLLITYGVTARAAREIFEKRKENNHPISLLILKTLWPVPENLIKSQADGLKRVVVVEMNLGQYVREIRRILPEKRIDFLGQMNGELIPPGRIERVMADG